MYNAQFWLWHRCWFVLLCCIILWSHPVFPFSMLYIESVQKQPCEGQTSQTLFALKLKCVLILNFLQCLWIWVSCISLKLVKQIWVYTPESSEGRRLRCFAAVEKPHPPLKHQGTPADIRSAPQFLVSLCVWLQWLSVSLHAAYFLNTHPAVPHCSVLASQSLYLSRIKASRWTQTGFACLGVLVWLPLDWLGGCGVWIPGIDLSPCCLLAHCCIWHSGLMCFGWAWRSVHGTTFMLCFVVECGYNQYTLIWKETVCPSYWRPFTRHDQSTLNAVCIILILWQQNFINIP